MSEYDGLGLAELVRKGEVTASDLVEEVIARIERLDPSLNAVVVRTYAEARDGAARPLPDGPFAGVPMLLKDLGAAQRGVRSTHGCRFFADWVPDHDSELVAAYRRAGFLIVGRTNSPELGITPYTEPELHGPTRNPWALDRTPGGSSGGAAAAVGARIVPIAHGGDGGGSIRIPASCCGLFGLKPSRGRTPVGPDASEGWQGLAVEHVITLSVRDSAAVLDATCPPATTPRTPWYPPAPAPEGGWLEQTRRPPGRLRIAWTERPFLPATVHPDCVAAVEDAARLCADLGHEVEPAAPPIDPEGFAHDFFTVVAAETSAEIALAERLLRRTARPRDFESGTWLLHLLGQVLTGQQVALARKRLQSLAREVLAWHERWDVLLTPTLGRPPPPIGSLRPQGIEAFLHQVVSQANLRGALKLPGVVERAVARVFEFIPFTPLANVTGQPAMNVPLFWNGEGLPVGVMFAARIGDEATLLRLAAQLEQARPWRDRIPPHCA
ncbi:MAG: amidase family protein [Myxococcota bacterium]|nr:amidase family protein [Myxococcota bacterium]MDW8361451.1 amidase family protein [Myxococcales bacterium]